MSERREARAAQAALREAGLGAAGREQAQRAMEAGPIGIRSRITPPTISCCARCLLDRQLLQMGLTRQGVEAWRAARDLPPMAALNLGQQEAVMQWLLRNAAVLGAS